jgi:hypothetical protein
MKIKLSELRQIVNSIIKEQGGSSTPPTSNIGTELAKMKNVPVRWYTDEANTKPYFIMTIKNIIHSGDRIKIEGLWQSETAVANLTIILVCVNNFVLYENPSRAEPLKLYNKKYIEKLKALLCTKSAGGVEVTNIGDYSSTTSKAPMNVAESKRKLTNVIRQVVKEQISIPGYAGGTYTVGKGADDAFKNAGGSSSLPPDMLKKIEPCLMKAGIGATLEGMKKYPETTKLILQTISSKKSPGMVEIDGAVTEVMSKGIDFTELTNLFTCILSTTK